MGNGEAENVHKNFSHSVLHCTMLCPFWSHPFDVQPILWLQQTQRMNFIRCDFVWIQQACAIVCGNRVESVKKTMSIARIRLNGNTSSVNDVSIVLGNFEISRIQNGTSLAEADAEIINNNNNLGLKRYSRWETILNNICPIWQM